MAATIALCDPFKWRRLGSALQAYAKQVNDADMEIWLAEMKLRARRKVGELSKGLDRSAGERTDKQPSPNGGTKLEAIKQAGLTKSVANRCEKIAEIPEEKFEAVIAEAKNSEMIRLATEIKVRAERRCGQMLIEAKEKAEIATQNRGGANIPTVSHGVTPSPPTLSDLDINRNQSSRWKKMARMDDDSKNRTIRY